MRIIEETVKSTDIQIGDYIKSFDITTERSRYNKVDTVLDPVVEEKNQILFKINGSNTSIITSLTHPMCYRDIDNSVWTYKPSSDIVPGDIIKAENKVSTIRSVHREYSEDKHFIDFEVQVDNNYYVSNDSKDFYVIHNSRPGACSVYFSWWHFDAPEMIELKEEGGTEDRRARKLQYGIKWNNLFTQRIINGQDITLFDPKETPNLLETSGLEFEKWYEYYENKPKIKKRKMPAEELAYMIAKQRIETGNLYLFFEETVQKQNVFNRKIHSSNLCVTGDTEIQIEIEGMQSTIQIKELDRYRDMYPEIEVKSFNTDTRLFEYKKIEAFSLMDSRAKLMRITDDQTGYSIRCTPDHKIWTENRGYVQAKDLSEDDILKISSDS